MQDRVPQIPGQHQPLALKFPEHPPAREPGALNCPARSRETRLKVTHTRAGTDSQTLISRFSDLPGASSSLGVFLSCGSCSSDPKRVKRKGMPSCRLKSLSFALLVERAVSISGIWGQDSDSGRCHWLPVPTDHCPCCQGPPGWLCPRGQCGDQAGLSQSWLGPGPGG